MSEAKMSRRNFLGVLALAGGSFLISQFDNIVGHITEGIQDPQSNLEFLKRLGENLYDKSVTKEEAQKAIIETLLVVNGLQNLSKLKIPFGYGVYISTYDSLGKLQTRIDSNGLTSVNENWPTQSSSYEDPSITVEIYSPRKKLTNPATNKIPQSIRTICGKDWSPSSHEDYEKFAIEKAKELGVTRQHLTINIFSRPEGALYIENNKMKSLEVNYQQDSCFAKLDGENKIFDISQHDYEEMMQLR